ncbi:hypothetical protein [Bacillus sp. ISL-46]|nr:hypothetical protein [Bacillus sp. ISL-46]
MTKYSEQFKLMLVKEYQEGKLSLMGIYLVSFVKTHDYLEFFL